MKSTFFSGSLMIWKIQNAADDEQDDVEQGGDHQRAAAELLPECLASPRLTGIEIPFAIV